MQLKCTTEKESGEAMGIWEQSFQPLSNFCDFSAQNSHFRTIWITFRMLLEGFEGTKRLKFGSPLKKLYCPPRSIQTTLNTCILRLNVLSDLNKGAEAFFSPRCATATGQFL